MEEASLIPVHCMMEADSLESMQEMETRRTARRSPLPNDVILAAVEWALGTPPIMCVCV